MFAKLLGFVSVSNKAFDLLLMLSNSSISIESFHHFDFSYFRVHFQTAKARKRWIHRSRWVCFHKTQKWIPSTHLKSLVRCFDKVFNIRLTFSNRWNWQLPLIFIILITLIQTTLDTNKKWKLQHEALPSEIKSKIVSNLSFFVP